MENAMINRKAGERKTFYIIGWVVLCFLLAGTVFLQVVPIRLGGPGCVLFRFAGVYCPGCGGTRAFLAFLMGHPLISLYFHPLVPYAMILFLWYMTSNSIEYLSKGRMRIGIRYHNWYLYVALGIIIIHWVRINIFLLIFHVPLG
mgnify:CR=1 FL=1